MLTNGKFASDDKQDDPKDGNGDAGPPGWCIKNPGPTRVLQNHLLILLVVTISRLERDKGVVQGREEGRWGEGESMVGGDEEEELEKEDGD